jgi:hypothetical protein
MKEELKGNFSFQNDGRPIILFLAYHYAPIYRSLVEGKMKFKFRKGCTLQQNAVSPEKILPICRHSGL